VLEGHLGTRPLSFTVKLTQPTVLPVTVSFINATGNATEGWTIRADSRHTHLCAGRNDKTVPLSVISDTISEPNETFSLVLSDATNAIIDKAIGVANVLDDDVTLASTHKATFTDVDGELVTIKSQQGNPEGGGLLRSCRPVLCAVGAD
jgi:hypothetical protein